MAAFSYKGIVRGKTVLLGEDADLPEGTGVLVTPLPGKKGSPQAVLEALEASRPVSHEAAEELRQLITADRRPASFVDPFSRRK